MHFPARGAQLDAAHRFDHALDDAERVRGILTRYDRDEFVAPIAKESVIGPADSRDGACRGGENFVPHAMPVLVVYALEVVEIENRQAVVEPLFLPIEALLRQALIQGRPIPQPRQAVYARLLTYSVQGGFRPQSRHNPRQQLGPANRLLDVVHSTCFEGFGQLILLFAAGQEDHRDFPGFGMRLELPAQ